MEHKHALIQQRVRQQHISLNTSMSPTSFLRFHAIYWNESLPAALASILGQNSAVVTGHMKVKKLDGNGRKTNLTLDLLTCA